MTESPVTSTQQQDKNPVVRMLKMKLERLALSLLISWMLVVLTVVNVSGKDIMITGKVSPSRVGDRMVSKTQLRGLIRSVLKSVDLYSEDAVELLMMTAATESKLGTYIKQVNGPALGIFQMEPRTEDDLWENYLRYKGGLDVTIDVYATYLKGELEWNMGYAIVMARIHYLRVKEKLPDSGDKEAMARYYKKYWNTPKGKATVEKAIKDYERYAV